MDRITANNPGRGKIFQRTVVTLVILLIAGMTTYKALDEGWLMPREPLDLSNAPVLLFFNRHKGCECEMVVYTAAESQINEWSDDARNGIQINHIDMNRRPDLVKQYDILRAPALFLVNQDGTVIIEQKDAVSDTSPLNLHRFESMIENLGNQ